MKKHARTNTHMLTIYPVIPVYFVYIVSAMLYVLLVVVVCCGVLVLLSYTTWQSSRFSLSSDFW